MLAPTHGIFGIFLTLIVLAIFGVQWSLHWTIILFAVIGSIMPDIDHPNSTIGRIFSFISGPLERRYGHRTVTHSLIGWIIFSVVFSFLSLFIVWLLSFVCDLGFGAWDLVPRWIASFSISYLSHLILDMFNPRGSQMFWPDPGRDVIPKNPKFRLESGAKAEVLVFFILVILMVLAFPLSKFGLASSLRWLLATPGSAIQEFKTLKTHAYLDFKGVLNETKEPIAGRGEVLDVNNQRLVILFEGNIYTLSDELAADIFASHVRVKKTDQPIKIERREFRDKSRDYLLAQIPKNALVSGTIHLPEDMTIDFSTTSDLGLRTSDVYKTIEQKGRDLVLTYASRRQIEKLALTQEYEMKNRRNLAELSRLNAQARRIRGEIAALDDGGLTALGKEVLVDRAEAEKQGTRLAELTSQLEELNVRIDELKLKLASGRPLFSGEVYIRR
ncbi:MAG: metal-dependent hydrolase [Candidatus Margulisbacteria bacterium]|nr:metal-dependent hydrolase [Candidatus Margulisiibacteriota bacterium]MBU1617515.1 metal-dependent hydrolase [Candidatus Margulisiibacteriota bacterium]